MPFDRAWAQLPRALSILAVVVSCAASPARAETEVFGKAEIAALLAAFEGESVGDFAGFAARAAVRSGHRGLGTSVARHRAGDGLDGGDRVNLSRLLGLYTRLKYADEMIAALASLVAIPTVRDPDIPQHENPAIIAFGERIAEIARDFGLAYRNVDNRIFEVVLEGTGAGEVGIVTHGDVVPVVPENWGLADGTPLDPFTLRFIDGKLYGRGTEDDKCSIVTALFAMRAIREAGLPVGRTIRLMIETTEETGGEGLDYYKARHPLPEYNIVLDSTYPLGIAEKGFGTVMARFPLGETQGAGPRIVAITGARATNQIPRTAAARLAAGGAADASALLSEIARRGADFVEAHGGDFGVTATAEGGFVEIEVTGSAAHSSAPAAAINPVARLFVFLDALARDLPLAPNAFTDAAAYVAANWGLDIYGAPLGLAYDDAFMGPLTTSVTYADVRNGAFEVAVNLRAPRGKSAERLAREIRDGIARWSDEAGIAFALDVETAGAMFRNPEGPWIETLLDVFSGVTGREAKPLSTAGATTARQLPNGVTFGPSMPDEPYTGHTPNEFKRLENFLLDAEMFTEMFLRIGNLERMS